MATVHDLRIQFRALREVQNGQVQTRAEGNEQDLKDQNEEKQDEAKLTQSYQQFLVDAAARAGMALDHQFLVALEDIHALKKTPSSSAAALKKGRQEIGGGNQAGIRCEWRVKWL